MAEPNEGEPQPAKAAVAAGALLLAQRSAEMRQRALTQISAARRGSDRLLDRTVSSTVRRSYDEYIGRVVSGLGRLFKGQTRSIATQQSLASALEFLYGVMPGLGRRVAEMLTSARRDTLTESIRAAARFVSRVQQTATALDDAQTMSRIILGRQAAAESLRVTIASALSTDLSTALRRKLEKLPIDELRVSELISEAGMGIDDEWWRVQRTVKTTTSVVYNEAQSDAIAELATDPEFRGLMSRWTELVDDWTGQPLDNRVQVDSMALHGQVARPGGLFTMPVGARVPAALIGKAWTHPPNRPNDRAVLTPWKPDWQIPAWAWQGGSRVSLSRGSR